MKPCAVVVLLVLTVTAPRPALADFTLSPWPEPEAPVPAHQIEQPSAPTAPSLPHFGGAGTLSILGSAGVSTSHVDSFQSSAMVDAAYFFRERASVGVELGASTFRYRGQAVGAYSVGLRGGYAIPLGDRLTFFPSAAFLYGSTYLPSVAPAPAGTMPISQNERHGVTLSADAFVLLHVTHDFFAGVDLSLRQDLTNYTRDRVYSTGEPTAAAFLTFGGWFPLGETISPTASSVAHQPI